MKAEAYMQKTNHCEQMLYYIIAVLLSGVDILVKNRIESLPKKSLPKPFKMPCIGHFKNKKTYKKNSIKEDIIKGNNIKKNNIKKNHELFKNEKILIYSCRNKGFSMGIFEGSGIVKYLPVLITIHIMNCLYRGIKLKKGFLHNISLSLIVAGALSNIYDRFKRGYVVDYININVSVLKRIVFNMADVYILLGSMLHAAVKI